MAYEPNPETPDAAAGNTPDAASGGTPDGMPGDSATGAAPAAAPGFAAPEAAPPSSPVAPPGTLPSPELLFLANEADSASGPSLVVEALRRIVFVGGILAAVYLSLWPAPALLRVKVTDFRKDFARHRGRLAEAERMFGGEGRTLDDGSLPASSRDLNAFIAYRTKDCLVKVSGAEWEGFFRAMQADTDGQSVELAAHRAEDLSDGYYYFTPSHAPLAALAAGMKPEQVVAYAALETAGGARHLDVVREVPATFTRYAPSRLAYPWRSYAIWFFLAALAAYALLPWYRPGPGTLTYSRGRAVVCPDWMGIVLVTMFFAIPVLVIPANSPGASPGLFDTDGGWIWLTGVCWFMALLCASLFGVTLYYATHAIHLLPDRLRSYRWGRAEDWLYAEITEVGPSVYSTPGWLRWLLFGAALLNWRAAGPALIATSSHTATIEVRMRDGRKLRVLDNSFPEFGRLLYALYAARAPLTWEVTDQWAEDLREAYAEVGKPPRRSASGRATGLILILLLAGAASAWRFWPAPAPAPIVKPVELTPEQEAEKARLSAEMRRVARELEGLTSSAKSAGGQPSREQLRQMEALTDEYLRLSREHDQVGKPK